MEPLNGSPTTKTVRRSRLDLLVSVFLIIACGVVSIVTLLDYVDRRRAVKIVPPPANSTDRRGLRLPTEPISVANLAIRGNRGARVGLIEFSDFECPYCATFTRDVLPALDKEYVKTGRMFIAFKHLPLDAVHRSASIAATAAECSRRQGRFWEMHDWLFVNRATLGEATIRNGARLMKLDLRSFEACMTSDGRTSVTRDVTDAKALGITGTPTFLIGIAAGDGTLRIASTLAGARPFAEFKKVIDPLLQEQASNTRDRVNVFSSDSGLFQFEPFGQDTRIGTVPTTVTATAPLTGYNIASLTAANFTRFLRDDLRSRWQIQLGARVRF